MNRAPRERPQLRFMRQVDFCALHRAGIIVLTFHGAVGRLRAVFLRLQLRRRPPFMALVELQNLLSLSPG